MYLITLLHYSLHFLFPGLIGYLYNRKTWKKNWLILIATMIIDIDHLLANPIFDPNRCSISFHPLHTYYAIIFYIVLLFPKKTRLVAIGVLFHIFTDTLDCYLNNTLNLHQY